MWPRLPMWWACHLTIISGFGDLQARPQDQARLRTFIPELNARCKIEAGPDQVGVAVALIGATPLAMEVVEKTGLHDDCGQSHRHDDRHRQERDTLRNCLYSSGIRQLTPQRP
jgi:hypothetical protein